jgi:hypothetical protein
MGRCSHEFAADAAGMTVQAHVNLAALRPGAVVGPHMSYMDGVLKAEECRDLSRRTDTIAKRVLLVQLSKMWDRVAHEVAKDPSAGFNIKQS